jgi:hypothetical protein
MTVNISLPATTEAKLRSFAAMTGRELSELVAEAIEQKFGDTRAEGNQSAAEFDRVLEEFFAVNTDVVSPLPAEFSRADIYTDHD